LLGFIPGYYFLHILGWWNVFEKKKWGSKI
jgi:hypothetical protein